MLVHELFTETIQGEGYWQGAYCDFVRLYGCPVRCHWCDTGYADGGSKITPLSMSIEEIADAVKSPRVVITGGEPFFNPQIFELSEKIQQSGRFVSIETSGAFWREVPNGVWVTLSPKEHVSSFHVDDRFWSRADEVKVVVESLDDFEMYKGRIDFDNPVYVQPCDNGKPLKESVMPCIEVISRYPKVRLSIQVHKLIGVR